MTGYGGYSPVPGSSSAGSHVYKPLGPHDKPRSILDPIGDYFAGGIGSLQEYYTGQNAKRIAEEAARLEAERRILLESKRIAIDNALDGTEDPKKKLPVPMDPDTGKPMTTAKHKEALRETKDDIEGSIKRMDKGTVGRVAPTGGGGDAPDPAAPDPAAPAPVAPDPVAPAPVPVTTDVDVDPFGAGTPGSLAGLAGGWGHIGRGIGSALGGLGSIMTPPAEPDFRALIGEDLLDEAEDENPALPYKVPSASLARRRNQYGNNVMLPIQQMGFNKSMQMMFGGDQYIPIKDKSGKVVGQQRISGGPGFDVANDHRMQENNMWQQAIAAGNVRRGQDLQLKLAREKNALMEKMMASFQPAAPVSSGRRRGGGGKRRRGKGPKAVPFRNVEGMDRTIAHQPIGAPAGSQAAQMQQAAQHYGAQKFGNKFAPARAQWNNSRAGGLDGIDHQYASSNAAFDAQDAAYARNRAAITNDSIRNMMLGMG